MICYKILINEQLIIIKSKVYIHKNTKVLQFQNECNISSL